MVGTTLAWPHNAMALDGKISGGCFMPWFNWKKLVFGTCLAAAALASAPFALEACTRCVYLGPKDTVVVARSMDWVEDPGTNLYAFPKGMKRNGASGRHE
jgi:hypothetical protein